MKREIKFRAWDPEKGMFNAYGFNEKFVFKYDLNSPEPMENIFPIKECVLMQFTGLTDKNGVDIYEGDILTYNNGYGPKKVVEYNSEKGWYRCKFHKGGGFLDTLFYYIERDCEIIGNIHENPELLC